MTQNKYETIVVGAGIAGLTTAAYIARAGKKVLLVEQNNEVGGLVNSFTRNDFRFEAGVRALEDAGIIMPMLNDLGIELEFVKSKVSVGVENEILNIDDINSLDDYRQMLEKLYPESKDEIAGVLKIIRRIMKHMEVLYGLENPVFKDLTNDYKFLFTKLLPWLPRFLFTIGKINAMNMPVEGFLAEKIKNQSLRDIISQHFFKGTPTFFALSYFSLYLDYFYPKGGVGTISEAMLQKFEGWGGTLRKNTKIAEVIAGDNMLKDTEGNTYSYNNMVWAADLKTFYKVTQTKALPDKVLGKFEQTRQKMLASRGSDSIFSLYLQVDEPLETFGNIANGHFFYTPSRQGLGNVHTTQIKDIINNWKTTTKADVFKWLNDFITLNTFEISIPGLKDPDLVPHGKTGMIISFLIEYDLFVALKQTDWYDEFKTKLETKVIDVITDSVYPVLKQKIIQSFSFTPLSYANRTGSSEGAIVGWSFEHPMPVLNKIQLAGKSVLTPVPNIYQAGQWAYSPAGVPMSILTGKLAADKVLEKK